MAKCLNCEKPETPWAFSDYIERANWVGEHRTRTGHSVEMWLGAP